MPATTLPKQTSNVTRDSNTAMTHKIITSSWNQRHAIGVIDGQGRRISEFRAVTHMGDFLNRQNYVCDRGNTSQCDNTGIPAGSGNSKFVPDSSSYTTFRRQRAMHRAYL